MVWAIGFAHTNKYYNTMTKREQLQIILANNPADDENLSYHTWIRTEADMLTFEEAVAEDGGDVTPDFTADDAQRALQTGEITVYSSCPIELGTFVTPSKMIAQDYAGGRKAKVYSKRVQLNDVAWICTEEGQYTGIGTINYTNMNEEKRFVILRRSVLGGTESIDVEAVFSNYYAAEDYLIKLKNVFVKQGTAKNMYWNGDLFHLEVSDLGRPEDDVIWDFKIVAVPYYKHNIF